MESIIRLQQISRQFGQRRVLDRLNLEIAKGSYVAITGSSGAGKSTLLNILGTLDFAFSGRYYLDGILLQQKNISTLRNHKIGFVFQAFNLIPNLSALENVLLPYTFYRGKIAGIRDRAEILFQQFEMEEQKNQNIETLSGGEKQRIALIRSIILDPEIILADEPTGNLDEGNAKLVRTFLREQKKRGKTVIAVTHDLRFAEEADRQLRISGGNVFE